MTAELDRTPSRSPTDREREILKRLARGWKLIGFHGRCRFRRNDRYRGWCEEREEAALRASGWIWHGSITPRGRAVLADPTGRTDR